jgi:PAS domain S-box-containing protein
MSATAAPPRQCNILLVDDRRENLLALEAILEPLGRNLVAVTSGAEALKALLRDDFALILLDVQMPNMDGFETAALVKQHPRSQHTPIIFLTAISKDAAHVFQGYQAGAVDYVMKPFEPHVLVAKVAVFVELWEKNRQVEEQAELLRERELAELARVSEERYRFLAESIPQHVWTARPDGSLDYLNQRALDYFGVDADDLLQWSWTDVIHPDDLPECLARWAACLETGDPYEVQFRLRASNGTYRWHLGRAVAFRDEDGSIGKWFGTSTDFDELSRIQDAREFIVEASASLGSSLDYEQALAQVAELAVPRVADWCSVAVCDDDGGMRQVAVAHEDPAKLTFLQELQQRYPTRSGTAQVAESRESQLVTEVTDEMLQGAAVDNLHLALLRELGLRSYMAVPILARERVLGVVAFAIAESGRRYTPDDVLIAEELARRAATAIENSQLYYQAEQRAQAAKVLDTVGDGVVLVDRHGTIQLWNPAAEEITGLRESEVLGRPAVEAIPGWEAVAPIVSLASGPGARGTRAETVPFDLGDREVWVSMTGVGFDEGTVYAFRDITEERAVEEMKADFVATVSHELRTPLAAIYGAAVTLRRDDLKIEEAIKSRLLDVVAEESERLAQIVNDVLLASHLDSGRLELTKRPTDVCDLAATVLDSAGAHAPSTIELKLSAGDDVPPVAADPDQLRRVLINLVDNAIKYSPEGGPVEIAIARSNGSVRISVTDTGLGIPPGEQKRIFEKFYRLDPNMTRGIGGTGLGLYISRELVRRLDGKIWVESKAGVGSSFIIEIPVAHEALGRNGEPPAKAAPAPKTKPKKTRAAKNAER